METTQELFVGRKKTDSHYHLLSG